MNNAIDQVFDKLADAITGFVDRNRRHFPITRQHPALASVIVAVVAGALTTATLYAAMTTALLLATTTSGDLMVFPTVFVAFIATVALARALRRELRQLSHILTKALTQHAATHGADVGR